MKRIHDPRLDLNLLKTFDALYECRSASRAAQALGIGQPAVSHALARLRRLLGDPLFVRSGNRMEPTPRAHRVADAARDTLLAAGRALAVEESFDPRVTRRIFSIAASGSMQAVVLRGLLAEMAVAGLQPALQLRSLDRDAALAALDEGALDLAIGFFPRLRRWHERQVLYEEGHVCLFNPDLLPLPRPLTAEAFAAQPHILPSLRGDFTSFVDEALEGLGLRRRVIATTSDFLAIPMMLKAAPLLATLPTRLARFCAQAATLATSPLPFEVPRFHVSMVWHQRDAGSASLAWLRERIGRMAPSPTSGGGP